mmetsp:Transcript_13298/g.36751  ORF Transcript_13298/g.36751 Transcript_13298/m.36751 type:complete len:175 (+) Transcript_13298:287-811(+)
MLPHCCQDGDADLIEDAHLRSSACSEASTLTRPNSMVDLQSFDECDEGCCQIVEDQNENIQESMPEAWTSRYLYPVEAAVEETKYTELPVPFIRRGGKILSHTEVNELAGRATRKANPNCQPTTGCSEVGRDLEKRYKLRKRFDMKEEPRLKMLLGSVIACIQSPPLDPEWTVY